MRFLIQRGDQIFGPYSSEEVRSYVQEGRLSNADLAQVEGTPGWIPLPSALGIITAPPQGGPTLSVNPAPAAPLFVSEQSVVSPSRLRPILRDAAIVILLTAIGGFIIGVATHGADRERVLLSMTVSNLLLGTVGFVISGCRAPRNRWRHLVSVALGVWLFGLTNVALFGFSVAQWVLSAGVITVMMGLGGGISLLLKQPQDRAPHQLGTPD